MSGNPVSFVEANEVKEVNQLLKIELSIESK